MKMESGREREEKLLQAIGNLPEEMLAQAAEYKCPNRRRRRYLWKGLAAAACFALVIFAGIKGISLLGDSRMTKGSSMMAAQSQNGGEAYGSHYNIDDGKDNKADASTDPQAQEDEKDKSILSGAVEDKDIKSDMQVWAAGTVAETGKKKEKRAGSSSSKGSSGLKTVMKEGKTVSLHLTETEDSDGERISVITIGFARTAEETTYLLHSQTSNCKIVSVSHNDLTRFFEVSNAECVSGDLVELDTRQYAEVSWEYNIVPEWEDINIIDIIDISRKGEGGEVHKLGRIVIGKSVGNKESGKEKYYGVYQKTND